jgi:D-alanine-D-alanine ligase
MKVAIVYNRKSEKVINVFGTRNQERYGEKAIARITDCLKKGGHQVIALEGDRDLIDNLEQFMPRVMKGERPGMVFNLAYGIQGQARYTHVPGILEMVGLPYVGSGPMAHSLALDKVVAKMIFVQHGLATPEFAVLESPESPLPDLPFPLIVKPRNEAVSFGIQIVNDPDELRAAAAVIFEKFQQAVLVERFIAGREVNVGLIGNGPPEALPPVELLFGKDGPQIYTYEDKTRQSGRTVGVQCPADLDPVTMAKVQELGIRAFQALGCQDCARVDMRIDEHGTPYILEINSLPSLGEHGSYVAAAEGAGLDFGALVNRLVEVASARYFGSPAPMNLPTPGKSNHDEPVLLEYVSSRRDRIERRIAHWTRLSSRTMDTIGVRSAFAELGKSLGELGMNRAEVQAEPHIASLWETRAGLDGGTLLIGHLDVPLSDRESVPVFQREPEWLHGEGIGSSRAPLVAMEFALQALKSRRRLAKMPLGVLYYGDEGRNCSSSTAVIRAAAARAKQVIVLRPGSTGDRVVTQRRGVRHFELRVEGPVRKLGQVSKRPEVMRWLWERLEAVCALSSRKDRVAVSVGSLKTSSYQNLLPHEVNGTVLLNYLDERVADRVVAAMRKLLESSKDGFKASLNLMSDRPPMVRRPENEPLLASIKEAANRWELPFDEDSSLLPSVAGLVPAGTPVVCGIGPAATEAFTTHEAVERIGVVQKTLLLTQFLMTESKPS